MTKKRIWEKRWQKKAKNLLKSTGLDFFASQAFKILDKQIDNKDRKILEIGSGTGRFCIALAQKYPEKEILGIDYTQESIALSQAGAAARKLNNVQFQKADLFHLPFKDNSFDFVFENGVIEHFTNYQEALREMKRVVKNGGKIAINVNNWYCFPKTLEKKLLGKAYPFGYEKSFKHKEVAKAFKQLGLKEIEVYAYNPFNYLVRFFFFNRKLNQAAAKLFLSLERSLNRLSGNRFSKRFGYMIFGVGRK